MATFSDIISTLDSLGVFNFILPFLLVFVVSYAILEKYKILGEKKSTNATVALIMGLFVTYFARLYEVGSFLGIFISKGSLVIIILLMTFMIALFLINTLKTNGIIPADPKEGLMYNIVIFLAVLVLVGLLLNSSPGIWTMLFGEAGSGLNVGADVLVTAAVVGGIIAFIFWSVS